MLLVANWNCKWCFSHWIISERSQIETSIVAWWHYKPPHHLKIPSTTVSSSHSVAPGLLATELWDTWFGLVEFTRVVRLSLCYNKLGKWSIKEIIIDGGHHLPPQVAIIYSFIGYKLKSLYDLFSMGCQEGAWRRITSLYFRFHSSFELFLEDYLLYLSSIKETFSDLSF